MNILYIGCGWFVTELARRMARRGASVAAVELNDWKVKPLGQRLARLGRQDAVHYYWGRRIDPAELLWCRLRGVRTVVTFIGSDVTRVAAAPGWKRVRARAGMRLVSRVNAVAPWLRDELADIGIAADVLELAFVEPPAAVPELPAQCTVTTYIPPRREDFYGWPTVQRLARDLPQVAFRVAGHDGAGLSAPPNVRFLGWVDGFRDLLAESSVYIRLTRHDGLAWSVVEALSLCRPVIWTRPYPHCRLHTDIAATRAWLTGLCDRPQSNTAGGRYVREKFAAPRVLDALAALYEG